MIKKALSSIFVAAFMSATLLGCGGGGDAPADQSIQTKEKKKGGMTRALRKEPGRTLQEAPAPETQPQEQQPQEQK